MSTTRTTDMGNYLLVETGEPTVENPAVWSSSDVQWKAGTPQANLAALQAKAQTALTANAAFLAIGSPNAAQTLAQVQILTRECNALVRLLLGQLDSTAGT